ncbi:MAG: hypothetical protein LLF96_06030 [Eubacteriales bacterium]|nr:hypothetical protein [Eubacteriales bacterium]
MERIDFDERFSDDLNTWIEKNRGKYKRPEALEEAAASYYMVWLQKPAPWLGGIAPGAYFDRYTDAAALVALLTDYASAEVPVPDPLLTRLEELAQQTPVLALLRDRDAPIGARMHAVDLLRQWESRAPMVDYLRWQVERDEAEELLDNTLDSLRSMGAEVQKPAKVAFTAADEAGKEALLDVLADFPDDKDVVTFALKQFQTNVDKRALYAGYLGKLDDDRALEPLLNAAEDPKIHYIDFIEIRSAIERLGGEAPIRDFTGDPTYAAVKRLQKR